MSKQELLDALRSEQAMAEYLEVRDDGEIISDIRSIMPPGISRRDYFAAAALTGLLANSENVHAGAEPTNGCLFSGKMFDEYAGLAVKMADALIAASKSEAHHG